MENTHKDNEIHRHILSMEQLKDLRDIASQEASQGFTKMTTNPPCIACHQTIIEFTKPSDD